MRTKRYTRSIFRSFYSLPSLTFIIIILMTSLAGCNMPSMQSASEPKFSDKNAQMYQMYSDSSADPAQNQLQVRRFIGQLHLANLEDIFGDIQSLPQDENCNYVGGPVVRDDAIWYVTVTPDLVGVNLISIAFDGTRSSAFDLDGDRIVDILDIRLNDLRRISFVTEKLGMDVFKYFVQNQNPFCDSELIRQLHLPELGCGETGNGSSSWGNGNSAGFFPGTNIVDPIEMLCSEYDTSRANFMAHNPVQGLFTDHTVRQVTFSDEVVATQETTDTFNAIGDFIGTDRITTYINVVDPNAAVIVIEEHVDANGQGTRTETHYVSDGTTYTRTTQFTVASQDFGEPDFNSNGTHPPSPMPAPWTTTHSPDDPDPDSEPFVPNDAPSTQGDPGPEGDDSIIAEFCRRRANHQSGIEQALEDDPTSMGVSCGDVVDAPSNPNCMFIEWAERLDFMSVLDLAAPDDGNCDPSSGERNCEPASVHEQISRIRGMTAELWSLDLPSINICPAVICDPSTAVEFQTYTAGQIEFSCAEIPETPTLEPSEENCPPGTYYAPVTNRCIQIQIQQAGGSGDGGGSSGACSLSTSACTSQGLSFDSGSCSCVPIQ